MNGLKTVNDMARDEVLAAVRALPVERDFVWDGMDDDERPASAEEMRAVVKKRGRPTGTGSKVQVAIRLDRDVVESFRATGRGWQTRMNDALREWVKIHPTG
jgi:uncharacterized protein (DUF4415 family)